MEVLILLSLLGLAAFLATADAAFSGLGAIAQARLRQSEVPADRAVVRLLDAPRDLGSSLLFGATLAQLAIAVAAIWALDGRLETDSFVARCGVAIACAVPVLLAATVAARTLATPQAEVVARTLARPVAFWLAATRPATFALGRLTGAVLRRLGGQTEVAGIAEDEFRALIDQGTTQGVVEAKEQTLIRNVLDFDDLLVRDVLVPIDRLFTLSESTRVSDAIQVVARRRYSRIPLWRGDPRSIVGVLYAKDLLAQRWGGVAPGSLRQIMRRPFFVLPKMRADTLLETFRHRRIHMAVVVDEFGRAFGVVTMEDLLEELFGPIADVAAEKKGADA